MEIIIKDVPSVERSAIAFLIHNVLTNYCIDAKYVSGIHYSEHEQDSFNDLLTSHSFNKPSVTIIEQSPTPVTSEISLPQQLEILKKRRCAIKEAMHRFLALNTIIPDDWTKELNEIHGQIHMINLELSVDRVRPVTER